MKKSPSSKEQIRSPGLPGSGGEAHMAYAW